MAEEEIDLLISCMVQILTAIKLKWNDCYETQHNQSTYEKVFTKVISHNKIVYRSIYS